MAGREELGFPPKVCGEAQDKRLSRAETLTKGGKPNFSRPAMKESHSYMHSICAKVGKNLKNSVKMQKKI